MKYNVLIMGADKSAFIDSGRPHVDSTMTLHEDFDTPDAIVYMIESLDQISLVHEFSEQSEVPVWFVFNDKNDTHAHILGFYNVNAKTGRGVKVALKHVLIGLYDAPPDA